MSITWWLDLSDFLFSNIFSHIFLLYWCQKWVATGHQTVTSVRSSAFWLSCNYEFIKFTKFSGWPACLIQIWFKWLFIWEIMCFLILFDRNSFSGPYTLINFLTLWVKDLGGGRIDSEREGVTRPHKYMTDLVGLQKLYRQK